MPKAPRASEVACCDQATRVSEYATSLPATIQDEEGARAYINNIDMVLLKEKLLEETGQPLVDIERAEERYKKWLFLRRKHRGELMPPTKDIDAIWHAHVLDTDAYHKDCAAALGYFLHHYPYFGRRGPGDKEKLQRAFENTKQRWTQEYNETLTGDASL
jgi:hypothetical protein